MEITENIITAHIQRIGDRMLANCNFSTQANWRATIATTEAMYEALQDKHIFNHISGMPDIVREVAIHAYGDITNGVRMTSHLARRLSALHGDEDVF